MITAHFSGPYFGSRMKIRLPKKEGPLRWAVMICFDLFRLLLKNHNYTTKKSNIFQVSLLLSGVQGCPPEPKPKPTLRPPPPPPKPVVRISKYFSITSVLCFVMVFSHNFKHSTLRYRVTHQVSAYLLLTWIREFHHVAYMMPILLDLQLPKLNTANIRAT